MSGAQVVWQWDEHELVPVNGGRRHRRLHVDCGGLVSLVQGKVTCGACGAVDDNAGWLKRVLMWNWHWIALDGYPGWDLVGSGSDQHPPFAKLTIRKGSAKSAREIEIEWDDLATGLFYHRDWTDDGIPFVNDGETYWAGFWFEKTADRDAFVARYGGMPS